MLNLHESFFAFDFKINNSILIQIFVTIFGYTLYSIDLKQPLKEIMLIETLTNHIKPA